jgi:hypothetical protein
MFFASISAQLLSLGALSLSTQHEGYLAPLEGMDIPKFPDQYVVILYNNHTLEQHFDAIGHNLSSLPKFSTYGFGYSAVMNETTRDEQVRRDPGVRMVETDGPVWADLSVEMVLIDSPEDCDDEDAVWAWREE